MSPIRLLYIVIRVIMGVVSMVANLFTLVCALRRRTLRSSANMLVSSLALCDLLRGASTAVIMPSTYYFTTAWHLSHPLCLAGICTEATSLQLQFVTFCMLAFERRNSLLFQLNRSKKWSCKTVVITLVSMWVVIAAYNITMTIIGSDVPPGTVCIVRNYYPKFFAYIAVLSFLATFVVITAGYGHIAWVAYKSRSQVSAFETLAQKARRKKDMAITKMMFMVVGVFFLLYCPFFITASTLTKTSPTWHLILTQVTVLLYDVIFWINPFIYAWRDKGFRKAFTEMLSPCRGRCCCLLGGAGGSVAPAPGGLQVAVVGAAQMGLPPTSSTRTITIKPLVIRDP